MATTSPVILQICISVLLFLIPILVFFYAKAKRRDHGKRLRGIEVITKHKEPPIIDIIAVHGLGAHPELTWTVPDLAVQERDRLDVTSADSRSGLEFAIPGRFNWLREYLPFDFPLARIMLFGHNADWFMDAPTVSSHETARKLLQDITEKRVGLKNRRILFIGHSYGGIILKKALVQAKLSNRYKDIKDSTCGIVFLGTPHQGSNTAKLGKFIAALTTRLFGSNKMLLQGLQLHTTDLSNLQADFYSACGTGVRITSVSETKDSKFYSIPIGLVVGRDSASLLGSELDFTSISVDTDHSGLNKCTSRNNEQYKAVKKAVEEGMLLAEGALKESRILAACEQVGGERSIGSISLFVPPSNSSSADRYCSSQLCRHWRAFSSASQFLWLRGPPKSGKTTAATQIVNQLKNDNSFTGGADVVYFLCSKDPSTSASTVLRSVIAQLILRFPSRAMNPSYNTDALLKALTPTIHTELSILWMLLRQMIQAVPPRNTYWLIDGLDALPADELDQLVLELRCLWDAWNARTGSRQIWLKVLVTSHPYAAIFKKSFADLPHIAPDEEVLAWISSLGRAATNLRQGTVEEAQTFTGDWIFKTQEYKEWRDSEYSDVLWLTGKAGSGKSTLMMKMLKETQRRTKQPDLSSLLKNSTDVNLMTRTTTHGQATRVNHSAIVASYFYYYKDEYRHVQMLQSLLFQILKQQEGMFSVYYDTYIELTSEGAAKTFSCVDPVEPPSTWSFTHLRGIFKALLNFQEYPIRIELFVDAVDESQETSEVIRILRNLASQATRTSKVIIKAVVTSRPMDDLPYRENEHRIAVEEHNAEDIERVIETGIGRISNKLGTFDEKVKALYDLPLLRNELIKRADGVILWISTVFKLIEYKLGTNQLAPADLFKTIDELPSTLTEMYERMIEQLEYQLAQKKGETQRRLNWATFAERTLHVQEFFHAVALTQLGEGIATDDLARHCVPHSTAEAVRTTLTTSCCGFLELLMPCEGAPVSGKDFSKSVAGIQLSHRTVKEFLQTEKATSFKVTEGPCVEMIVNVCIQYLRTSFLRVEPTGLGNGNGTLMSKWTGKEYDIFASYLEERPLIFYIFENLPAHMKSLDPGLYKEKARELLSSVKEIYKSNYPGEPILSLWMLQEFPRDKIAARRLLNRTMEGLLNTLTPTNDLQQNRGYLTTLLDAAVRNNNKIAVRILCAAGILAADDDHNAYSMAVQTAAKSAHWDMIEYLDQVKWHNRRAEPATGTALDRPLVIACESGHLAAATMLLRIGANPEFENKAHARPIHLAAMKGHKALVELLIQKGAECDARDGNGRTSLWWAVESGHEAIVELLLNSQASPDIEDKDGENPLRRAIFRNDEVVIQLLRNAGADMTAVDDDVTAIDKACAPCFMVPFRRNENFVGRESELQYLQEIAWDKTGEPVVIGGLGGMGKTQLAVEYAYSTRDEYPEISVLWIDASSDVAFTRSYTQAYTQLQRQLSQTSSSRSEGSITASVGRFHRLLSSLTDHRWLIIWDNFDLETDVVNMNTLESCIPRSSKDQLIVTTRNLMIVRGLDSNVIRLEALPVIAATGMLLNGLELSIDHQNGAQLIIEELGAFPLATVQAARYISHAGISLEDYLSLLRDGKSKLFSTSNRVFDEGTSNTDELLIPEATTFALSFDLLDSSATDVLSLMSTLDCNGIPEYVLLAVQDSQSSLLGAMYPLIQLSLVKSVTISSGRKCYSIDPLVQAAFRSRLKTAGELEVWEVKALEIMSKEFPRGDAFQHRDKCAGLILHALAVIEGNAEVPDQTSLLQRCQLSKECGAYLMATGTYTQAETLIQEAYLSTIRVIQQDDERTVSCLTLLGKVLLLQGKHNEADKIIQRALSKAEEFLGPDCAETLSLLDDRTLLLLDQGRYMEAEQMGMEALNRRQIAPGGGSTTYLGVLTSMNNLAAITREQGRLQEATEWVVPVLASRQKLLGEHHPDTLISKSNLALIYRDQGHLDEAAALGGEILYAMQKVLGKNHPHTLNSMNNLAVVSDLQGKYKEAKTMCQETLKLRTEVLGQSHPDTLTSMNNLAVTLSEQGMFKQAESMDQETLELRTEVLGQNHPDTLTSMSNLAVVSDLQGKYEEARTMCQETLKLRTEVLGQNHPDTLTSMNNLAVTLRKQGMFAQATSMDQETFKLRTEVLGKDHPDILVNSAAKAWHAREPQASAGSAGGRESAG